MGMLNHLGNFIPNLADLGDPLCQLLRKGSVWVWGESQQKAAARASASVTDSPGTS